MILSLLLTACFEDEPKACTDLYAYSVTATVASSDGAELTGVVGSYTVDGGAEKPCTDLTGGQLVCGGEEIGHFVVTLTADGHEPQTLETDVESDGCHAMGEALEFVLEPVACTDDVRPALEVHLASDGGQALQNAAVVWSDMAMDMEAQPCVQGAGDVWTCADEHAGELWVYATADNHGAAEQIVTVGLTEDECHVDTQVVELVLAEYDCVR